MALVDLLGRPIAYHRIYRDVTGSTVAALFLSQITYWQHIVDKGGGGVDGWIYKTIADFESETGLSRHEQMTARKSLKKLKILKEKKMQVPCKLHYQVDWDVLEKKLQEYQQIDGICHTNNGDTVKQACDDAAGKSEAYYHTPNRSETTSETTSKAAEAVDRYVTEACKIKNPKNMDAYAAVIRRRIAARGGLTDSEREQLENWEKINKPLPTMKVGDVIVIRDKKHKITQIYESAITLDDHRIIPKGILYSCWSRGDTVICGATNN